MTGLLQIGDISLLSLFSEGNFLELFTYLFLFIGIVVFVILFFINAGYGRYASKEWGFQMDNRIGWLIMEAVSPIGFFILFLLGNRTQNIVAIVFLLIWEMHYFHRAFIYPFRIRGKIKIPLVIVLMGLIFNGGNVYLQGRYLFTLSPVQSSAWLYDLRFIIGATIFVIAFTINLKSDQILRNLRKPGDSSGYKIPYGNLYRYISCPNYFGEILEWIAWAVLTWSLVGFVFAIWTAANLIPRALAHHKWYHERFPDYPSNRKAIIPFLL
jgi:protein-S-isoprenylcysteine O-methyltransferase Ste14